MSSQKRELQKQKKAKAIRKANAKKSIRNILIGVGILLLVALIGYIIYYKTVLITQPIENYSEGLTAEGTIDGVTAKDYVTLCDYQSMEVAYSELAPTQDEIDSQINSVLETYKEYSTEAGIVVELYDTINLDYVGTIDGVAFDGGSTSEGGVEIVVGEAGYIDDFEDQLVGRKTGSSFDIEVTFPEDYGREDLNGKDAVFSITINGIYVLPEFDDAFVKENLSDTALTADAYREYLEEEGFESELESYIQTYIVENSKVTSYPEEYTEDIMGITKFEANQEYEYMNEYYYTYMGVYLYDSFADYVGVKNELEYEAALRLEAEKKVAENLIIQAIYEDAGLTVTSEHLDAVLADMGTSSEMMSQMEEMYGKGYLYQLAMKEAVIEYLVDTINVVK